MLAPVATAAMLVTCLYDTDFCASAPVVACADAAAAETGAPDEADVTPYADTATICIHCNPVVACAAAAADFCASAPVVACAAAAAAETGAPDEACPPGMRANAV